MTVNRIFYNKNKYILPLLSVVLSVAFYLWIQKLPDDQPRALLTPISAIVGSFLSLNITAVEGAGFAAMSRGGANFIIDKSCSGAVFLVICFSLLCVTQIPRFKKMHNRIICFFTFLGCSYLFALIASVLRIIPSVLAFDFLPKLNPVLVHNTIGIITFVTVISASFLLVERQVSKIMIKDCDSCEEQSN